VGMVNNHSLSEKDALEKIYSMYAANPNHKGICNNLSQLAEICIMKYIISNDYNSYSVKNTLNKIIKNKSSEFQNQSSIFRKAYNDIWSQLPNDTKLLLSDNSSFLILGQTLNEKGQALKEGLDLMKQLGGFTNRNSNRFGSINSLLSGDNDLPF
jgi:ABC-type Fe3+-citrate transport system substrate-binding protein